MSLSGDKEIDVRVRVVQDGVTGALRQVENAVSSTTKGIENSFLGANGVLSSLQSTLTGVGEAIAAAFVVRELEEFVNETVELGVQLERLSQKTGISAQDLGELKFAATETGTPMEALARGLQLLAKNMQLAAEGAKGPGATALKELGISAKDADGNMRPMQDVMLEIADKFHDMEDGATKTALAMRIFGRGGAEMIPMLNQGGAAIADMKNEAVSLGAVMSGSAIEGAEEYHQAMGRVGLVHEQLSHGIGNALIPVLTSLANAFADSAKEGGGVNAVIQATVYVVQSLAVAFALVVAAVEQMYAPISALAYMIEHVIVGVGRAIVNVAHGDFAAAADNMRNTGEKIKNDFNTMMQSMRQSVLDFNSTFNQIFGKGEGPAPEGKKHAGPTDKTGSTKDTRHAQLAELMEGFKLEEEAAQGNAEKIVEIRQRELAATRALFAANSKEVLRAQLELAKAEDAHRKQATKAADDLIDEQRDHALTSVAIERENINAKRAMGQISAGEQIADLKILMDREYEIKLQAAIAERDLLDQNTEAYRQADAKIRAIQDQHRIATVQSTNASMLNLKQQFESAFSSITNAVSSSIQGIIQGTQTLRGALANIFQSITLEFIQAGLKRLASHIATELAMSQASAAGAATRTSIDWGAAAASVAAGAWAAITNIANYAAQAIAAAWAAISAIPIVGPFLAPAVALAAGAAIFALAGDIRSASGGYDVPTGINPVTQLHAREMVLPAHLADRVRDMTDGGAGSGGGDTYKIYAMDSKSFDAYLHKNGDSVGRVVKKQAREGKLG